MTEQGIRDEIEEALARLTPSIKPLVNNVYHSIELEFKKSDYGKVEAIILSQKFKDEKFDQVTKNKLISTIELITDRECIQLKIELN